MQQLAGPIFEDKVIDYILEMAQVTDVENSDCRRALWRSALRRRQRQQLKSCEKGSQKSRSEEGSCEKSTAKKAAAKKKINLLRNQLASGKHEK